MELKQILLHALTLLSIVVPGTVFAQYGAYNGDHNDYLVISGFESNSIQTGDGQGVAALGDGKSDTYFHSQYKEGGVNEAHYIQATLNEKYHGYVYLLMQRRANEENNHPTQFLVSGRLDRTTDDWRPIARWYAPYDGTPGSWVRSGALYIPFDCDALRFTVEKNSSDGKNSVTGQVFFHCAEFKIEKVPNSEIPYDLKLANMQFENTMGVLDSRNHSKDEYLQNWCEWAACWDSNGDWMKDTQKLEDAGISIPSLSLLKNGEDNRINASVVGHQRTHTEEHTIYAVPGDVVRLAPYSTFMSTASYHQRYVRWYDYATGGRPDYVDFHTQSPGVFRTGHGYFASNNIAQTQSDLGEVGIYDTQISTADDYVAFVNQVNTASGPFYAVLTNDIDLSGRDIKPMKEFSGVFRGNGFALINMKIDCPDDEEDVGMFGSIRNYGTTDIYDIRLVNAQIKGGNFVGGFVGRNYATGLVKLSGLSFNGTVTGNVNTGGILGCNNSSGEIEIRDCCVSGEVNGKAESAAIAGWLRNGYNNAKISCCYNIAEVSGVDRKNYFYRAANDDVALVENCYDAAQYIRGDISAKQGDTSVSWVTSLIPSDGTYYFVKNDDNVAWFDNEEFLNFIASSDYTHYSRWRFDYTNPVHRVPVPDSKVKNGICWGSMASLCIPDKDFSDGSGRFADMYVVADIAQHFDPTVNYDYASGTMIEPTVQLRHLFTIKDGRKLADDLTDNNGEYIKKTRRVVTARAGHEFQIRLDYPTSNSQDAPSPLYYRDGYGKYRRVFNYEIRTYDDEGNERSGMFFFDGLVYYYGGYRFDNVLQLDCAEGNGYSYYRFIKCERANAEQGRFTVKLFAKDASGNLVQVNGKDLQVAEYVVTFVPEKAASMHTETALNNDDNYAPMRESSLNELYGTPKAVLDFDNYRDLESETGDTNDYICSGIVKDDGGYKTIPDDAGSLNTYGTKVFKWNNAWAGSSYGFGYNLREDYSMYVIANHSKGVPYNGACDNRSASDNFGKASGLYDRLFYNTEGRESGYFYYVNASADPGTMADLGIGDLCAGTTLYVSAWIAEFSRAYEVANVVLNIKAKIKNGDDVTLNTFVTGYVDDNYKDRKEGVADITARPDLGKWMHVYYSFVPNLAEYGLSSSDVESYHITIENNCQNSSGADYAIDDIRVWAAKPRVSAEQINPVCSGEDQTDIRIELPFDILMSSIGEAEAASADDATTINMYYTFLDKQLFYDTYDMDKANYEEAFSKSQIHYRYMSTEGTEDSKQSFGKLSFGSYYNGLPEDGSSEGDMEAYRRTNDYGERVIAFDAHPQDKNLRPGKEYILALYVIDGETVGDPEAKDFNIVDPCCKTCEFRVHASGTVKIDGVVVQDLDAITCCANQQPVVQIDLYGKQSSADGKLVLIQKDAYFDWYDGPMSKYLEECSEDGSLMLHEVMSAFRGEYPDATTCDVPAKGEYSEVMKAYLLSLVDHQEDTGRSKLYIHQSSYVFPPVGVPAEEQSVTTYVVAIPIDLSNSTEDYLVCTSPAEVFITVSNDSPKMLHGLPIPYPDWMTDVPLRIGLGQLESVSCNEAVASSHGKVLSIPVRSVYPATANVTSLKQTGDNLIYLVETNDPAYRDLGTETLVADGDDGLAAIGELREIKAAQSGIGNILRMVFYDDNPENSSGSAKPFRFHEGYYYRMKFAFEEDLEGVTPTTGLLNTPCDGELVFTIKVVPEYQQWTGADNLNWNNDNNWRRVSSDELYRDQDDNDTRTTDGDNHNTFSYAPLDFTKVMIAGGETYPFLYKAAVTENVTEQDENETFEWPKDPSPSSDEVGPVTNNVQYDMASRNSEKGVGCRPWYMHTCDQIHFRPNAEIMNQNLLTYNKAWVEMAVDEGRWYTLASPLKAVVAGDMYLPKAGARQKTELFKEIKYSTTDNDRFAPAVYQRAWNKASATVYEMGGANRNVAVALTWSNVYNDVKEPYGAGTGFSIKADASRVDGQPSEVLFRLPKDDAQYYYYESGNAKVGNLTDIGRDGAYRLNEVTGTMTVTAASNSKYFLVGNPFMAHLDMKKFLEENSDKVNAKYWIMTGNSQTAAIMDESTDGFVGTLDKAGTVPPMQGFFVEALAEAGSLTLKYDETMMCVESYTDDNGNLLRMPAVVATRASAEPDGLTVTAISDGVPSSRAMIRIAPSASVDYEEREDVAMLDDPTQADLARVYTVAGSMVASVNSLPELVTTELGVLADSRQQMTLRFDGTGCVDGASLYDSATGESMPLYDGMEYKVKGACAGRLFIVPALEDVAVLGFRIDRAGHEVTVTAPDRCGELEVNVYDMVGRKVLTVVEHANMSTFSLDSGIFVIEAVADGGDETFRQKLIVR